MNPVVYVSAYTSSPTGRRVYYESTFPFPDRISDDVSFARMRARFVEEIGRPVDELVILFWRRLE